MGNWEGKAAIISWIAIPPATAASAGDLIGTALARAFFPLLRHAI